MHNRVSAKIPMSKRALKEFRKYKLEGEIALVCGVVLHELELAGMHSRGEELLPGNSAS